MSTPLNDIEQKVFSGRRVTREEAIQLMESNDILALGRMANHIRQQKVGDKAYFTNNLNINPTNICEHRCELCAFSRDEGQDGAYLLTLEQIEEKIKAVLQQYGTLFEAHIVSGLYDKLPFSYYTDMLRRIKAINAGIHIQAFTAVELDYFSRIYHLPLKTVLSELQAAGLGSIPGGGAEVFSDRVREKICNKKISGQRWLDVHELVHQLGMHSNATLLYGHVETLVERVDHLLALRDLQDKTNGFLAFVPLAFHPGNTAIQPTSRSTTGFDDIKVLAVARIVLDNFSHIKALWTYTGLKMAQISLEFGVDDLGGISLEEKIVHAAGARTAVSVEREELIRTIRDAGRTPIEVDSIYQARN